VPIGAMFRVPQKSNRLSVLLSPNSWSTLGK
jgi:hypothetical protein